MKNTLATVQSIITQTAKTASEVHEFRTAVEGRVLALSRAHSQLSERSWTDADLRELLHSGLDAYINSWNVTLSGDAIRVPPRIALMISMAVHELATNAAKYGALSTPAGRIDLSWDVKTNGTAPRLSLSWVEQNGPAVAKPGRSGFGTRLLERGIQMELQGDTSIEFSPSGVKCAIQVPLANAGQ